MDFHLQGIYVIISSDTVTVTNQPVDIGTAEEEMVGLDEVVVLMKEVNQVVVLMMEVDRWE